MILEIKEKANLSTLKNGTCQRGDGLRDWVKKVKGLGSTDW